MDIPTTLEVISHRSMIERDGTHSQIEHILDGLAVVSLEFLNLINKPDIKPQKVNTDINS
jgi:hypothetical protein